MEPEVPGDLGGLQRPSWLDLGLVPVTGLAGAGASGRAAASRHEGRGGCHVCPSRRLVLVAPPRDAELRQQHSDRTGVSASPQNPLPEAPGPQQPGPASLIYRNVRRNMHTILLSYSSSESPGCSAGRASLCTVVMVLSPGSGACPHSAVAGAPRSRALVVAAPGTWGFLFSSSCRAQGSSPHARPPRPRWSGEQKALCRLLMCLPGS